MLLRAFATPDGYWRLPADLDRIDPHFLDMLVAYEDQRFWDHHGVDVLALLRAAGQLVTSGHIVSGGSTLTMQLARLIEPRDSAHHRRQALPDRARPADRAAADQARDPRRAT